MTRTVLKAFLPMCLALLVAGALTIAFLTSNSLVASTDRTVQVWNYQFRVQLAVELTKGEADTVLAVGDTLAEVSP